MKILLFCLLFFSYSYAQDFEWLLSGGGTLSDKATSIAVDDEGFSYITGYFNEGATFGNITIPMVNPHSKEVFVAKIDPNGNYVWVKSGENYYDDRGLGLCLDPFGNVYVTGTCWGGLTFGSLTLYNNTSYTDQIYVLKLDNNGNEIWLKNAGVNESGYPYNDDHGFDIASDQTGNLFVTGFISNNDPVPHNAEFDNIMINVQAYDSLAFVAKLSNDGVWQWVKTNEGIDGYRDNRIAVDNENNVYVTGGFKETASFGTTSLTSFGSSDIYVVKYSNDGDFIFATHAGSELEDRGNDITYGKDEHLYVTGEFKGKAVFGNDTINNYGNDADRDIFVARISKNGTWDWVKKAGSTSGGDRGNGICTNNKGNIFVTGQYKEKAKFGGSIELDALSDSIQVFIAAIDSTGKWKWALDGGGPDYDRGNAIACDTSCNVYIVGYYAQNIHFSTNQVYSLGKKDFYTLKIKDACFDYDFPPEPPQPEVACTFNPTNVFTPNGDGTNDELLFFSDSCANEIEGQLKILNRWGTIVFQTNNFSVKWTGTDNQNNPVPDGVYFYNLNYISNSIPKEEQGFITVLHEN